MSGPYTVTLPHLAPSLCNLLRGPSLSTDGEAGSSRCAGSCRRSDPPTSCASSPPPGRPPRRACDLGWPIADGRRLTRTPDWVPAVKILHDPARSCIVRQNLSVL